MSSVFNQLQIQKGKSESCSFLLLLSWCERQHESLHHHKCLTVWSDNSDFVAVSRSRSSSTNVIYGRFYGCLEPRMHEWLYFFQRGSQTLLSKWVAKTMSCGSSCSRPTRPWYHLGGHVGLTIPITQLCPRWRDRNLFVASHRVMKHFFHILRKSKLSVYFFHMAKTALLINSSKLSILALFGG